MSHQDDPGDYAAAPQTRIAVGADDKAMTIVVYVLYLLGFVSGGLTAVVGVVMAYALKSRAGPVGASHYVFQIRTFWLAALWLMLGGLVEVVGIGLAFILIGLPIIFLGHTLLAVTAIWYAVRSVLGLLAAVGDRAYGRPRAWIV